MASKKAKAPEPRTGGIGIDFGTTRTVVAWADRGNYPVVAFEDGAGDSVDWFPSVVAARGRELRFGFEALAAGAQDDASWTEARSFKRLLAGPDARADRAVVLGGETFAVAELVTGFLRALRDALRERSSLPEDVKLEAVVATPANAFCTQRFVTLEAFRAAGFDVRAMLNEPSAAGFEYSHRHARTLTSNREHVVVYDLGGGTFDASLVKMTGTHHDAVATGGLARLGGDDFDRALAEMACEAAGTAFDALSPAKRTRLLDACRDHKEKLNPSSRKIVVDVDGVEASVNVADFYERVTPLVEATLEAMAPVMDTLGASPLDEIAGIYVVGGASSLPVVGRLLRDRFGRRVHRSPYPHAAIAIGLAIASDGAASHTLADRFSRNFGVFREADGGTLTVADPIFTRDLQLPAEGDKVTVARRYRAAHDVGHFRFFECSAFGEDGQPRGDIAPATDVRFAFDPELRAKGTDLARHAVRRLGNGPLVEERYAVDARGLVELTITDLDSGYAQTQVLGA